MQLIKNPTAQQAIKVVTIAGASVLVVGAAMSIFKAKSFKEAIFPSVSILVGVAAFGYAMNKKIAISATTKPDRQATSSAEGDPEKRACHCSNRYGSIDCGETVGLVQCVDCCKSKGGTMVSWGNTRTLVKPRKK